MDGGKTVTKDQFNSLDIKEQVKKFNSLLLEHKSIKQAGSVIGIARSTIQTRFKKAGYSYVEGQYILSKQKKEIKRNKKVSNKEIIDPLLSNKEKVIESNINLIKNTFYPELMELLQIKDDLKAIVQKYNQDKKCIDIENTKLEIVNFKGDLKVKSIKIYDEVLDRFNKFMKVNKGYKQQEVISQALWEFLEKYEK